jgi:hypothetical protein
VAEETISAEDQDPLSPVGRVEPLVALEAPDRCVAHRPRLQWPHRGSQQLDQRVKRAAFGFTSFRNYRIRTLLYAGNPDWDLLATITPR